MDVTSFDSFPITITNINQ